MAERRKVRPDCIYVSNPFHECSEYCIKKTAESKSQKDRKSKGGSFRLDISKSFGRKKGSRPKAPKEADNGLYSSTVSTEAYNNGRYSSTVSTEAYNNGRYSSTVSTEAHSLNSHVSPKKTVESRNGDHISSTKRNGDHISSTKRMHSEEIHPEDPSLTAEQEQLDSTRIPSYESLIMPDYPEDALKQSPTHIPPPMTNNKNGDYENHETLVKENLTSNGHNAKKGTRKPSSESSFSLSGFEQTLEDSDEGEIESVNSELCVPVGNYNVKASFSNILTLIFDKYGDIAATCKLESVAMRSYYLECVCYVIQELQSTEFYQLTRSKVKELVAILKDVESSQINVGWLKTRLDEITQAIELRSQHRAVEAAKGDCEHDLDSTKKELESQLKLLAIKEQEVSNAKSQVAETRAQLSELELKSTQLKEMITSINSKVENLSCKSFSDDLL